MYCYNFSNIIDNNQNLESNWVAIDSWMDFKNMVYIHNGILFTLRRQGIILLEVTDINLKNYSLSNISLR